MDEFCILNNKIHLIEKKHSNGKLIPGINDIKDAFIKMLLFANIDTLRYHDSEMPFCCAVGLTSQSVQSFLHSKMTQHEINQFCKANTISHADKKILLAAIEEAQCNRFGLFVVGAENASVLQNDILEMLDS